MPIDIYSHVPLFANQTFTYLYPNFAKFRFYKGQAIVIAACTLSFFGFVETHIYM